MALLTNLFDICFWITLEAYSTELSTLYRCTLQSGFMLQTELLHIALRVIQCQPLSSCQLGLLNSPELMNLEKVYVVPRASPLPAPFLWEKMPRVIAGINLLWRHLGCDK